MGISFDAAATVYAVVLLSIVLGVNGGRQVTIPLTDIPMPGLCTFKRMTGLDCPGCGLTRSFISLGHGDVLQAWAYNPAGPLMYAVVLFQIPYRVLQLWRISHGQRELRLEWWGGFVMAIVGGLVLLQWVIRQIIFGMGS